MNESNESKVRNRLSVANTVMNKRSVGLKRNVFGKKFQEFLDANLFRPWEIQINSTHQLSHPTVSLPSLYHKVSSLNSYLK